jgi:hypothetical protein
MSLNRILVLNLHPEPCRLRPFPRPRLAFPQIRHRMQPPSEMWRRAIACLIAVSAMLVPLTFAQPNEPAPTPQTPSSTQTYPPKFPGDPARSDSEAEALAYMRVVLRAQRRFNKQYGHFATSLAELVHSGSFTKRMVNPQRGDYTATFKGKKDSFVLTMTPKNLDAQHRSFYAEDDGKIHADETKPADASSPLVK